MMILRAILLQTLPRLASVAPLARLILDQCECPAIVTRIIPGGRGRSNACACRSSSTLTRKFSHDSVGGVVDLALTASSTPSTALQPPCEARLGVPAK